jgi:purine-binding chemotaxis protein CheW
MSADASPAEASSSGDAYLTLRALDQIFALPIEFARSVFKIDQLTRVPLAPPHLVGLSHLQGRIVGIVCLGNRLDPGARALGVGALAIAIELGAETFALAVQGVGDIVHARPENISANTNHAEALRRATSGVIRAAASLIPVLDPFSIFGICRVAEAA